MPALQGLSLGFPGFDWSLDADGWTTTTDCKAPFAPKHGAEALAWSPRNGFLNGAGAAVGESSRSRA